MTSLRAIAVAIGFATAAQVTAANAAVMTSACAGATSCTLAELLAGGSIQADDVLFDGFASNTLFGPVADPGAITVTGLSGAMPGLRFGIGQSVANLEEIENGIDFDVSVQSSRTLTSMTLELLGFSRSGDAGVAANAQVDPFTGPLVGAISNLSGTTISDSESLASLSAASMLFDWELVSFASDAQANLDSVYLAFALEGDLPVDGVVPLPAGLPLLLGALAMLGVVARRRQA